MHCPRVMSRRLATGTLAVVACGLLALSAGAARAQVLQAIDDAFPVPYGTALTVEAFGVLDNDLLDGEPAGENGATAELVSDVSHGVLALGSDGSFSYTPGPGFDGSDGFVYRAVFGSVSSEATVVLSACGGGPQVFTCWKQAAFLALAAELGHPSFHEGFEDDGAWGAARSPYTLPQVVSRGVSWRANDFDATHTDPPDAPPDPGPNEITTGPGAARSGAWGVFDPDHGYAWGTAAACDVDTPAAHCLFHDGVTLARVPGGSPLFGAGAYVSGTYGANVSFVLDGDVASPVGGGSIGVGGDVFFGVIDAGPTGWNEIQLRELDGKIGQALLIFADDFTVLAEAAPAVPGPSAAGRVALGALLCAAAAWSLGRGRAGAGCPKKGARCPDRSRGDAAGAPRRWWRVGT